MDRFGPGAFFPLPNEAEKEYSRTSTVDVFIPFPIGHSNPPR